MLKILDITNFTCFPSAKLKFSPGLNIVVGENGTGKSHLLKLGYAMLRSLKNMQKTPAKDAYARDLANHLVALFKPDSLGRLVSRVQGRSRCEVLAKVQGTADISFNFSTQSSDLVNIDSINVEAALKAKPLFIPPKEILSIYPGFALALENKDFAFDETYLDISKNLNGVPLKGKRLLDIAKHLNPLEELMGGDVRLENNSFYFHSSTGKGIFEAHLMAEGSRKLGMLAYLLKTGELTNSSSLFWDEPEANLNPRFLQKLVAILATLSNIMQITISTHSLFLLREFDILQEQGKIEKIRFFGLNFAENGNSIVVSQGDSISDIGDIVALDESISQTERYRESQYGV